MSTLSPPGDQAQGRCNKTSRSARKKPWEKQAKVDKYETILSPEAKLSVQNDYRSELQLSLGLKKKQNKKLHL